MADWSRPSRSSGSLVLRILIVAAALFVALSIVGWLVGAVISLVRTLVIISAILFVAWIVLVGRRR